MHKERCQEDRDSACTVQPYPLKTCRPKVTSDMNTTAYSYQMLFSWKVTSQMILAALLMLLRMEITSDMSKRWYSCRMFFLEDLVSKGVILYSAQGPYSFGIGVCVSAVLKKYEPRHNKDIDNNFSVTNLWFSDHLWAYQVNTKDVQITDWLCVPSGSALAKPNVVAQWIHIWNRRFSKCTDDSMRQPSENDPRGTVHSMIPAGPSTNANNMKMCSKINDLGKRKHDNSTKNVHNLSASGHFPQLAIWAFVPPPLPSWQWQMC